ncbi:MAG: ABC transporter ATP-binding protein [Vicinamibacterales bacterium]
MASITLDGVSRVFPGGHVAVRDLSLQIRDGELLVLVGPSGSGKSTVLRLIAGLDDATSGRVLIGDEDVTAVPPQARDLAMVFQSYALYPHMTVRQNLEFGLRMRRTSPATADERVRRTAEMLGIAPLLDRRPSQLSGGQRQRVAVGRALAREARAYLLDEPLSNLDPLLRVETRTELGQLHRRLGSTMVYVTHDQEEAMTLGTRIAVMREGRLEQVGAPLDLYRRPANRFVAQFIGTPAMNVWRSAVVWERGLCRVISPRVRTEIHVQDAGSADHGGGDVGETRGDRDQGGDVDRSSGDVGGGRGDRDRSRGDRDGRGSVDVGVRPHDIELCADEDDCDGSGRVEIVEPLGPATVLHVRTLDARDLDVRELDLLRLVVPPDTPAAAGDRIRYRIRRSGLHLFDAATGRRW